MSNRPILDAVEAVVRDLRGAVYAADDGRGVRARRWLAESGLRPTVPTEATSAGRLDFSGPP